MPLSFGVEIIGDGMSTHGPAALARRLDEAQVSYWVIGDGHLDASVVATVAARHSRHLGLVVAAAAHRDHPYNLARRLLSVDHAAQGRAGWFARDADPHIALDAARDVWTDAPLGVGHTSDAVAAVRTLWRTWPRKSVIADHTTGVFADITQIHRADVQRGYRITGPMNVPGSVQGDLPVWAGVGVDGADLVVVDHGDEVPDVPTVVRINGAAGLGEVDPRAAGVLVRVGVDDLDTTLEQARGAGYLAAPTGTLRGRLALPVPDEPDVSTHELAFTGAVNPGGRL